MRGGALPVVGVGAGLVCMQLHISMVQYPGVFVYDGFLGLVRERGCESRGRWQGVKQGVLVLVW